MVEPHRRRGREPARARQGLRPVPGVGSRHLDAENIRPFVDRALDLFGPSRLMYGGDWPISVAAGGYDHVFAGLEEVVSDLSDADGASIGSGTAREFYRIDPARLAAASGGAHR